MKKGRRPQRRQVTVIQARRGDSRSNDQAERVQDPGGFIFKGRFCRSDMEDLVRRMNRGGGSREDAICPEYRGGI